MRNMEKYKKLEPIERQLLSEITEFCERVGMSERAFGLQVVNNNKMISQLRNGKGMWSKTINAIREYISAYNDNN